MGAGQSIPPDPIPDPNIFINIGCVGLDSRSFNGNRLSSAPFLSVNFQAGDYYSMINNIVVTLQTIKPGWTPVPPQPKFNFDLDSSNLTNFKKHNKKNSKTNNDNSEPIETTVTTPSGKTYKLYNGYNEELDMQERLDELSSLIAGYKNNKNNDNTYNSANSGNMESKENMWAQLGGSLNGQTIEYWNTKYVFGPIYLLAARDQESGQLDCYLYFPSMTKDSRLWPNQNYLGLAHNWMYLLLFGAGTRIQWCRTNDAYTGFWYESSYPYGDGNEMMYGFPGTKNPCLNGYTKCKQTFGAMPYEDHHGLFGIYYGTSYYSAWQPMENRFMFGCKTNNPNNPYSCQQSTEAHKGMGIFNKYKSPGEYPIAYYHSYSLRSTDSRINSYINNGPYSLQYLTQSMERGVSCGLAQHVLPAYTKLMQGASMGMVSQNNRYFLVLSGYNLTLYINYYDLNLAKCAANNSFIGMGVVFNIPFSGGYNSYVTIEDNLINIYSATTSTNTILVVKSIPFIDKADINDQYTLILNNTGTLQVININNTVISSLDPSKFSDNTYTHVKFNKNSDYYRRLLNLKLYLIFRNVYIDAQIDLDKDKDKNKDARPKQVIPAFNSNSNYMQSMVDFLEYLR